MTSSRVFRMNSSRRLLTFTKIRSRAGSQIQTVSFGVQGSWICVPGSPSHYTLLTKLSYFDNKQTPLTSISQGTGSESMSSTLTHLHKRRTHCFSSGRNCCRLRNVYLCDFCPRKQLANTCTSLLVSTGIPPMSQNSPMDRRLQTLQKPFTEKYRLLPSSTSLSSTEDKIVEISVRPFQLVVDYDMVKVCLV